MIENYSMNNVTYIGQTNFRNKNIRFGIKQSDRLLHTYVIGKTGTGKTTLLKKMCIQDIEEGRGMCLLDPHGDMVSEIAARIPEWRRADIIYLNIPDKSLTIRYNPFRRVSTEKRSLVASSILDVFKKLWSDAWGVKLEHILRNTILTLLDQPYATIEDIPRILLESSFRQGCVKNITNESIKRFWQKEFPNYNRYDLLPVLNKVGGMLAHPVIKRTLIENPNEISLRRSIDSKCIILVNLSKGHLGDDVANILGSLLISSISSAAFSRVDTYEEERVPFMLYLDEFHNFTTLSLVNMFSELRKFKVGLVLAHQYLHQLEEDIKKAVLGNIGTIISFRLGVEDSQYIAKEMYPVFKVDDFTNLPNFNMYIKLMIDGIPSKPFSALSKL